MKKILMMLGVVFCLNTSSLIAQSMSSFETVTLIVDLKDDDSKEIHGLKVDGVVMISAQKTASLLNADLEYKPLENKIYLFCGARLFVFEIGKSSVWVDGKDRRMNDSPRLVNGEVMLPVDFVSQELGFQSEWLESSNTLFLKSDEGSLSSLMPGKVVDGCLAQDLALLKELKGVNNSQHLSYDKSKGTLTINISGIEDSISILDDYKNRAIKFQLGKDYSQYLQEGTIKIEDSDIDAVGVLHTKEESSIVIKTNVIKSPKVIVSKDKVIIELKKPREHYQKIVVLDAGHGGKDVGAIGADGTYEKDLNNLFLAQTLKAIEEISPDTKTYVVSDWHHYYSLQDRVAFAEEIGADLFISIHSNAATNKEANGTEVLYCLSTGVEQEMAQLIQDKLVNGLETRDRKIKERKGLYLLNKTTMPAFLIEVGFVSNQEELLRMKEISFQEKLGILIAIAIEQIFSMEYYC